MGSISRRHFLHDSALAAAALALGETARSAAAEKVVRAARKGQANDRLRVAVLGVRSRGVSHVHGFANRNNCVVTTICDAVEAVIGPAMKAVEKAQGKAPRYEQDLRRVVEDKNIDIITIATPNHWHALAAIWGLQNGKDVYVEKPVSHNVSEGRRLVEAARKYHRVCQAGTQSRSMPGMRQAMAFLHSGKLGKIKLARGLCYNPRPSIGWVNSPQPIPKTCDYDLWCGPAPKEPLMRRRLHYDWHWVWNYGNGDLGNQGIHEMDKARWGLGKNELARSVLSVGGRFGYQDDGQTANTQVCVFDYGDCALIFEVRGLPSGSPFPGKKSPKEGPRPQGFVGNVFYGTEGFLVCPNYRSGVAYSQDGEVLATFEGGDEQAHYDNFVKAVRSRKAGELNADILDGHLSSALCHLGNVSYLLGTPQPFSKKAEAFGDDKEAAQTLAGMVEHLKINGVPLDQTTYQVGRKLTLDPKAETFLGDPQATRLLTREYRKGFEVPQKV
jgi:predicted dehydrogenase